MHACTHTHTHTHTLSESMQQESLSKTIIIASIFQISSYICKEHKGTGILLENVDDLWIVAMCNLKVAVHSIMIAI